MIDFKDKNYYEILGLKETATADQIKKAYRSQAKKYHPDIAKDGGSNSTFKIIYKAYEILSNSTRRKKYDMFLAGVDYDIYDFDDFDEFDPTWIDDLISSSANENIPIIMNKFKKLSTQEKYETWGYIWLSFWHLTDITVELLASEKISFFLEALNKEIDFTFKLPLLSSIDNESRKSYITSINNILESIDGADLIDAIKYIEEVIDTENIFDDDISVILAFDQYSKTLSLLRNMEACFVRVKALEEKRGRENKKSSSSKFINHLKSRKK